MTFTSEELTQLSNPYQDLGNGDALAEHQEELDKLSLKEMRALATRMITQCPDDELNAFSRAISALHSYAPSDDKPSFHSVMEQALGVKKRILSLVDKRHNNPQRLILDDEFSVEHFHNFRTLAQNVLTNREATIAERLVQKTAEESLSQLARKIQTLFPDSVLATKVQSACGLRREIQHVLLGDNPLEFFTSKEFNQQRCFEFSKLFSALNEQESRIAERLVINSPDSKELILGQITNLFACSQLESELEQAFTLSSQINAKLLGETPANFFLDAEFDADQCNKFGRLFQHLLSGHEQQIGEQLASLDAATRSTIGRKLEILNGAAHAQNNCARTIAQAIDSHLKTPSPSPSFVASGNSLFSTNVLPAATEDKTAEATDSYSM